MLEGGTRPVLVASNRGPIAFRFDEDVAAVTERDETADDDPVRHDRGCQVLERAGIGREVVFKGIEPRRLGDADRVGGSGKLGRMRCGTYGAVHNHLCSAASE